MGGNEDIKQCLLATLRGCNWSQNMRSTKGKYVSHQAKSAVKQYTDYELEILTTHKGI